MIAPVHQTHRGTRGLQLHRSLHGGFVTTEHAHRLPRQGLRIRQSMQQAMAVEFSRAFDAQAARLKSTDACRDEDAAGDQALSARGLDLPAAIGERLQGSHGLVQMELRRKGSDLLLQQADQFAAGAAGNARDVVDGFVTIQLDALATHLGQGVDDVATDVLQTELKGLPQPHRASPDDERVGLDRGCVHRRLQRTSSLRLPVLSFQASASGKAALRLVMLGQPSWANSAFSAVMCC